MRRGALLQLLENELSVEKRLVLVSAPAGYGKTTLIIDWLQNVSQTCWVSLEKSDNDPRVFLSYLIASLQKAFPGIGEQASGFVGSPQLPPLDVILLSILNDLAGIEGKCIIVLDDYHAIHTTAIHEAITFLLDHLPAKKHVVITTRSDPALPLHRYRSRGQMIEIRASDLRFSLEEVSSYMTSIAGVALSQTAIAVLEQRTEGWAAGLQMAAISLRGKKDKDQFIRSLTGTHRYILDYLMEEVMTNQPEDIQRFLIQSAILDRLCAPLCSALTTIEEETSQKILQSLEQENLFIVPLDDERYWYRYHHLFQDLLVMRLKQSQPDQVSQLHTRAASWYEQNGCTSDAVQHYIEGAEFEHAAELVEQHTVQLFGQGKLDQLVSWIEKLPVALTARRPWLSVYQAWALAFAGKIAEASQLIEAAKYGIDVSNLSPQAKESLEFEIRAIRGVLSAMSGDYREALALTDLIDKEIPSDRRFARSAMFWSLGFAWRAHGQLDRAITAFQRMLDLGRQINNLWTLATGFADLGMVLRQSGRLKEAEAVFRKGLLTIEQAGTSGLGFVGRLESFLANVLCEQDKLVEAEQLIVASISHNQLWNNPNHLAYAYLTEARIRFAKGDSGSEHALKRAEEIAIHAPVVPSLRAGIEALRVRFWLAQGLFTEVDRWTERHKLSDEDPRNIEVFDTYMLAHLRIAIAQENWPAARQYLERLEKNADAGGRVNTLIETLTLKALAAPNRVTALERALQLGVPEGYRRVFLDEGKQLQKLLKALRGRSPLAGALIRDASTKRGPDAVLTAREQEILRAMAEGLSNKEIGQKLYISAGTVKAHSSAIYRKLETANRTEAIARAKDLGLI
jgi:LuxR family maltose regulon positive regulatory protein